MSILRMKWPVEIVAVVGTLVSVLLFSSQYAEADGPNTGWQSQPSKLNDADYDPNSRTVTVTDEGSQPGSAKSSRPSVDSGDDEVSICGVWYPVALVPPPGSGCLGKMRTPVPPAPVVPVAQIARQAAASVILPLNTPVFGPSPTQNKWGMIPVGYPVWLWTSDSQSSVSKSVTQSGLSVAVSATRQKVVFTMGDGHAVSCTSFSVRPTHLVDPSAGSPSCGYVYQTTGTFMISAATTWLVTWRASGQVGSFTVTDTAEAPAALPVGELSTVIIYDPTDTDPPH